MTPEAFGRALYFARLLTRANDDRFNGAAAWVRDDSMWEDPHSHLLVEAFRRGSGCSQDLRSARGAAFDANEQIECEAYMALLTLAQWDVQYVDAAGELVAFISHDQLLYMAMPEPLELDWPTTDVPVEELDPDDWI